MTKIFIAYDSKYGNAKLAEKISEGIKEFGGIKTAIGYVKEIDIGSLVCYDAIYWVHQIIWDGLPEA